MGFRRPAFTKLLFESPSVVNGEEEELKREDFDFERRLGDGAFGQVWRVRHKKTSHLYALKQVPKDKVTKMLPQFRREVYIMYELNHPHIIKLYNHFEDEKNFYLIMELAEGGNLFHKLYREKQFLERVAAQYFREVGLAVEYLHSHVPAIIHRDIKPENILLDKDGRLKLTDFGWSNYYSKDNAMPRFTTCGTLEYLPPEMVEEKGHDTSADIWCLGILLYEMLNGSTPFKATVRDQMLRNIANGKPKFPLTFPAYAKDLISKMLEKEPARRLNIQQVINHKWMLDHPPMRATITQELQPKPLPDLNTENPNIPKGYVVISKQESKNSTENSEPPEEVKSPTKKASQNEPLESLEEMKSPQPNSYRQSIQQMKQTLSQKEEETKLARHKLQEQAHALQKYEENIKFLDERINEKRKELALLTVSEKEMLLKISDVNLELEKLQSSCDGHATAENNAIKSKELLEKTNEVKLSQKNLENLREEVKMKSMEINEKEKNLNSLQIYLRKLLDEAQNEGKEKKSKINELEINSDVLRTRLETQNKTAKEFGKDEKVTANEIMGYIQTRYSELGNPLTSLEEKIIKSEETIIETEQLLSNSKLDFEEKRAQVVQGTRKKKDEIAKNAKRMAEDAREEYKNKVELDKQALREELNEARKLEIKFFVEDVEIDHAKEKINSLKKELEERRKKIVAFQANRKESQARLNTKKKEVEDTEMEYGTLKAQMFHNPQIYDEL